MQIVFRGDCLGSSGYSTTTRNYVIGLHNLGVDVKVEQAQYNFSVNAPLQEHQRKIIEKCMNKPLAKSFIYINRVSIEYHTPHPQALINVASTAWETTKLSDHWVNAINGSGVDAVIVPSMFNKSVFESSGVNKPVFFVREALDFGEFKDLDVHDMDETFKFFSLFQWLPRKGYDVLIQAYLEEFTKEDNVSLYIKTSSLHSGHFPAHKIFEEAKELKKKVGNDLPIYLNVKNMTAKEIKALYAAADCFVLPTRGEGSCIPVLEAMASRLPIIATGWSGQMQAISNENAFLLDYKLTNVPPQWYSPFLEQDQLWAEPDKDHLRKLMRLVYNNREEAKDKADKAFREVSNFSTEHAARDIIKSMESIVGSIF